jgi:hypothetical protein
MRVFAPIVAAKLYEVSVQGTIFGDGYNLEPPSHIRRRTCPTACYRVFGSNTERATAECDKQDIVENELD